MTMRIILQEDIEKLGTRGQVVEVASGYARNYLLPRNLAIPATEANLKRLENIRGVLAKRTATERELAQKLAEMLSTVRVTLSRKAGESDQLFGSVTAADIAEALAAQGYEVDKRRIHLEEPIKLIGEYEVHLKLHTDVATTVKVVVNREA
jgi:large subunit ribosomal protein L9